MLLFTAIYSLGMYIHITATTLSNSFIGREINVNGDTFWKMVFLIVSSFSFAVFFWI